MHVGVQFFPSAESIGPVAFARAAEERGFESVFFPDHTHVPVGAEVPEFYRTLFDPIAVLGAVAATTSLIRIGTAVCLVPERDPIILAKQIATIDQLSGGRLLFGVGAGSNEDELRHHGTDPGRRFAVLRERIAAMTAIWTSEEAEFSGDFVRFGPLWSWPKPVQRPRPPILLGGMGSKILERVVEYADGWMPYHDGTGEIFDDAELEMARRIRELDRLAKGAGRTIPVTLFNASPRPAALRKYAELGVTRVVFWLPTADEPATLSELDRLEALVSSY